MPQVAHASAALHRVCLSLVLPPQATQGPPLCCERTSVRSGGGRRRRAGGGEERGRRQVRSGAPALVARSRRSRMHPRHAPPTRWRPCVNDTQQAMREGAADPLFPLSHLSPLGSWRHSNSSSRDTIAHAHTHTIHRLETEGDCGAACSDANRSELHLHTGQARGQMDARGRGANTTRRPTGHWPTSGTQNWVAPWPPSPLAAANRTFTNTYTHPYTNANGTAPTCTDTRKGARKTRRGPQARRRVQSMRPSATAQEGSGRRRQKEAHTPGAHRGGRGRVKRCRADASPQNTMRAVACTGAHDNGDSDTNTHARKGGHEPQLLHGRRPRTRPHRQEEQQ